MVCRNFILPEICKPCLFLFTFQFAKLILPYPPVVFLIHYELLSANIKYANKKESGGRCDEKTPFLPPQLGGFIPVTKDWRAESGFSSRPPIAAPGSRLYPPNQYCRPARSHTPGGRELVQIVDTPAKQGHKLHQPRQIQLHYITAQCHLPQIGLPVLRPNL